MLTIVLNLCDLCIKTSQFFQLALTQICFDMKPLYQPPFWHVQRRAQIGHQCTLDGAGWGMWDFVMFYYTEKKDRQFGNFAITGGTVSWQYYNLQCLGPSVTTSCQMMTFCFQCMYHFKDMGTNSLYQTILDSKIDGVNVGPTWGRQDPDGPHVCHTNLAIWDMTKHNFVQTECIIIKNYTLQWKCPPYISWNGFKISLKSQTFLARTK